MSLLPGIANPYIEALAGGLLWGSVFCTSTCLPYVASYIAGIGAGFRKGIVATVFFNTGRIVAYALIGAAIGVFRLAIDNSYLASFQQYSSTAFGLVSIVLGVILIQKTTTKASSCECPANSDALVSSKKERRWFDFGAFTLGLSRGFVLCVPLFILLAYAATFASPFDSVAVAVLFGIGTAISPLILLGGATGWLLTKAPLFRVWVARIGGAILIILGVLAVVSGVLLTQK